MQPAITREEASTNITGLSLVLFLFLSFISMMAAYEANKPPEEARTSVVVSLHEYTVQSADAEENDHSFLIAFHRLRLPAFAILQDLATRSLFDVPARSKDFDARGPPSSL